MGIDDKLKEGDLFNRWADDYANTLQTFISKSPLLSDGARSGGTGKITHTNGTFTLPSGMLGNAGGTFGTFSATYHFAPQTGWIYDLHSINFNIVNPTGDSGTLGSMTLNSIRADGVLLGTVGAIDNCKVLFGEDIALYGSLSFECVIKLSGTSSLGTEGTWSVNTEVTGWKFQTMD